MVSSVCLFDFHLSQPWKRKGITRNRTWENEPELSLGFGWQNHGDGLVPASRKHPTPSDYDYSPVHGHCGYRLTSGVKLCVREFVQCDLNRRFAGVLKCNLDERGGLILLSKWYRSSIVDTKAFMLRAAFHRTFVQIPQEQGNPIWPVFVACCKKSQCTQ